MNAGGQFYAENKMGIRYFTAYKFFDSKELLFFVVLEDIHTEGFAVAQHSLQGNAALPPAERGAAIPAACRWLPETRALVFIENDAEFLLRRLPQDILSTHCHDDEGHIRALPEESGLCPRGGTAPAAVRGLILTVSHQDQIGQLYPQVFSLLVHGACRELF